MTIMGLVVEAKSSSYKKGFAYVPPNYKVMEDIDWCEFVATQQSPGDALVRSSRHFGTPTSRINNKMLTYI